MGRFVHEACAVDPRTGIVYMTEDNGPDGFYRYIPDHRKQLHRGGKLQMLCVNGRSKYDTVKGQKVGKKLRCEWVTIDDVDPEDAERHPTRVYDQGRDKGAARFMGLEGANWGQGSVWFTASESGDILAGQVWKYTPSKNLKHGTLELMFESTDRHVLDEPDAIVVSPRGGTVLCEDGDGDEPGGTNFLRVLTPSGKMETFAQEHDARSAAARERSRRSPSGRGRATARTASGSSSTSTTPASATRSPGRGTRAGSEPVT